MKILPEGCALKIEDLECTMKVVTYDNPFYQTRWQRFLTRCLRYRLTRWIPAVRREQERQRKLWANFYKRPEDRE